MRKCALMYVIVISYYEKNADLSRHCVIVRLHSCSKYRPKNNIGNGIFLLLFSRYLKVIPHGLIRADASNQPCKWECVIIIIKRRRWTSAQRDVHGGLLCRCLWSRWTMQTESVSVYIGRLSLNQTRRRTSRLRV